MRILLGAFIAAVAASASAPAHDAVTGWEYPYACCSNLDCRDVPADWIKEGPDGYQIVMTGEIVGYADTRVRKSPDGLWHWCSVAGENTSRTLCLFAPEKAV